jgi:hypothetical protein
MQYNYVQTTNAKTTVKNLAFLCFVKTFYKFLSKIFSGGLPEQKCNKLFYSISPNRLYYMATYVCIYTYIFLSVLLTFFFFSTGISTQDFELAAGTLSLEPLLSL